MKINSNISSMMIQRNLASTSKAISRSLERLSSGSRINSARDDADGLAISTRLDAQVRGLRVANQNVNQAQGMLTTAESAIDSQLNIVIRMRELAVQAANGTLTSTDRSNLNLELSQLFSEFQRITNSTEFNGTKLLDGSFGQKTLQVSANRDSGVDLVQMQIGDLSASKQFVKTVGSGAYATRVTTTATTTLQLGQTADFNKDGKLDYIAADPTNSRVSLFLGNGDGTFQAQKTIAAGSGAYQAVVGDFNGDGAADFATSDLNDNTVSVFLGNGDGTFATRVTYADATFGGPAYLQAGDINHDGITDLVSLDVNNAYFTTFFGQANGTFRAGVTSFSSTSSFQFTLSDVTGDGNLDIVQADNGGGSINIFTGLTDGTFGSRTLLATTGITLGVVAGDVNGDGFNDIIYSNIGGSVSVYLNNGNGTFATRQTYTTQTQPQFLTLADMNNDGKLDIVAPNHGSSSVSVILNNGDGTFKAASNFTVGNGPTAVSAGDLNGDGVQDIISIDNTDGTLSTRLQYGFSNSAVSDVNISTQSKAQALLSILDATMTSLKGEQAKMAALHSRLDFTAANNLLLSENFADAKSKILDTDLALETADLVRNQILQQAQVAVLTQANVQMQLVLQLLK